MADCPTVGVLGNSLLVEGVAVSLEQCQKFSLVRIDSSVDDILKELTLLNPDVILFELELPHSPLILSLLKQNPGILFIGLDLDCNRVIVLNSRQQLTRTARDLCQIVEVELGDQLQLALEKELANSLTIKRPEIFPASTT